MSIRSFLVHARPGYRDAVTAALAREPGCEVYPAENADLLVLVTDHAAPADEDAFDDRLAGLEGITGVALVAGFSDDESRSAE